MGKRKRGERMNIATLIALAGGVGTANAIALDNVALGLGISIFITGIIALGIVISDLRSKAKRNTNQHEQ